MAARCTLLLFISMVGIAQAAQDVLTVGGPRCVSAIPGQIVIVPVFIRDASGTPLGVDHPAGRQIENFGISVGPEPPGEIEPAPSGILQVPLYPAGLTASLGYTARRAFGTSTTFFSSLGDYTGVNVIPFRLDAPLPGDLVAELRVPIKSSAAPGTINLRLLPGATLLGNRVGTLSEMVPSGTLSAVSGCITVANGTTAIGTPTLTHFGIVVLGALLALVGIARSWA